MANRMPAPACSQAPLGASCCCCKFCDMGGCDVRVMPCACCLHARCCPVSGGRLLTNCPICSRPASSLQLMPMAFAEIDEARKQAAITGVSDKRGKKRKNATIARLTSNGVVDETGMINSCSSTSVSSHLANGVGSNSTTVGSSSTSEVNDLRTGRWTTEETEYCDSLIRTFEQGMLPLTDGVKLNDFLSSMLKSKQSRLTKKMKNARLSARQYRLNLGYIPTKQEATDFSRKETEFFASIKCPMERSEIRFHMQKEWREMFSSYCAAIGQSLDAGDWLTSVEELEVRQSMQKDAARMIRRKVMMGQALTSDSLNSSQRGVYIDVPAGAANPQGSTSMSNLDNAASAPSSMHSPGNDSVAVPGKLTLELAKSDRNPMKLYASPFIARILQFIHRHKIPFEHVDVWVPSFVNSSSNNGEPPEEARAEGVVQQHCRLCFAGCGTTETKIPVIGGNTVPLTQEERFNLLGFGDYSQKFSFDVGCGLPGRVYSTGVASWEQGIQNAPPAQFERSGGASQWGIQTVLGIPIASQSVGRIVVLFYSIFDRERDLAIVSRLSEDLHKLRPYPKWKLVVDVGVAVPPRDPDTTEEELQMHYDLLNLIQQCTPADKNSPLSQYLPGFTALRILLTQQHRSVRENDLLKSILSCFDSYRKVGRTDSDIATMTARDFMVLSKQKTSIDKNGNPPPPQQQPETQVRQHHPIQSSHYRSQPMVQANGTSGVLQNYGQQQNNQSRQDVPQQQFSLQENQIHSLGASPTMQPIAGNQDTLAELAPLGLSAAQLAAILQNDAQF